MEYVEVASNWGKSLQARVSKYAEQYREEYSK